MFELVHPVSGGKLFVAKNEFEKSMKWKDAVNSCKSLGRGWRLPTTREFELIHEKLGGTVPKLDLNNSEYWTNDVEGDWAKTILWYGSVLMNSEKHKDYHECHVLAVRST
jgi:hypothetical protein